MVPLPNRKTLQSKKKIMTVRIEKLLSSKDQQKWVTNMLCYDFEIIYKKGKHNVVEDALSRK
jgi:hypothetical protein